MSILNTATESALSTGLSAASFIGKAGYKSAFGGNVFSRGFNAAKLSVLGAGVGGVAGFMADDSNNPQQRLEAGIAGAGIGAVAGTSLMAAGAVGRLALRQSGRTAVEGTKDFAGNLYNTGKRMGNLGLSAASFAIRHPIGLAATGAGIYGAAYATRLAGPDSPTLRGAKVNAQYDRQAIAAANMQDTGMLPQGQVGTSPQMYRPMQIAMEQSAEGLVQGLHRSRHG